MNFIIWLAFVCGVVSGLPIDLSENESEWGKNMYLIIELKKLKLKNFPIFE